MDRGLPEGVVTNSRHSQPHHGRSQLAVVLLRLQPPLVLLSELGGFQIRRRKLQVIRKTTKINRRVM